jgi:hypothetical protein
MHGPVIIAMVTVRMVQTTVYEVVDMVIMRHRFMSAVWTVRVRATDLRRALHRICGSDPRPRDPRTGGGDGHREIIHMHAVM